MKRELRYGANVEWFLNDIAAAEMSDIDSGEFEIYGEDEAGREACTYIDITELAADAAQMIRDLTERLQAAEHLAELRGRQNLDTQKKLDALAAENAALKSAFHPENLPEGAADAVNSAAQFDWDSDDCGSWTWVVNDDDVAKAVICAITPPHKPQLPTPTSTLCGLKPSKMSPGGFTVRDVTLKC